MQVRRATTNDIDQLKQLYFNTVLAINSKHYTKEQVEVWASTANRTESLLRKIAEQYFYVACDKKNIITGFASLDSTGYLDMMYVHKDFQRRGIASILLYKIFDTARSLSLGKLITEASITAKPFFEKNHFIVVEEQTVFINETPFTNYRMQYLFPVNK